MDINKSGRHNNICDLNLFYMITSIFYYILYQRNLGIIQKSHIYNSFVIAIFSMDPMNSVRIPPHDILHRRVPQPGAATGVTNTEDITVPVELAVKMADLRRTSGSLIMHISHQTRTFSKIRTQCHQVNFQYN